MGRIFSQLEFVQSRLVAYASEGSFLVKRDGSLERCILALQLEASISAQFPPLTHPSCASKTQIGSECLGPTGGKTPGSAGKVTRY